MHTKHYPFLWITGLFVVFLSMHSVMASEEAESRVYVTPIKETIQQHKEFLEKVKKENQTADSSASIKPLSVKEWIPSQLNESFNVLHRDDAETPHSPSSQQ